MPRPRVPSPFSSGLPAGLLGHRLDHGPRARVFQMCKAESDRIGAGRGRELIHEGFEREHVGIGAERAQRRDPDRHVLDEMMDHPLAREIVERNGVAIAAAGRLRRARRRSHLLRLGEIPGREHIGAVGGFRPCRMAVAPHLVLPVRDLAVASKRRLGVHHHGGTIRLPAEFVVAHPLQTDRAAGHRPRQQRGVERQRRRRRCGRSSRSLPHARSGSRRPAFSATLTSSARNGKTPCECVHTVMRPSLNSATEQDGPIEPCDM